MKKIHEKMSIVLLMLLSLAIIIVGSVALFSRTVLREDVSYIDNGQYQAVATTVSTDYKIVLQTAEAAPEETEPEVVESQEPGKFDNWMIWFLTAVIILVLIIVETLFFVQLSRKPKAPPVDEKPADLVIIMTEEVVQKQED